MVARAQKGVNIEQNMWCSIWRGIFGVVNEKAEMGLNRGDRQVRLIGRKTRDHHQKLTTAFFKIEKRELLIKLAGEMAQK
jgi:hypothetical protein